MLFMKQQRKNSQNRRGQNARGKKQGAKSKGQNARSKMQGAKSNGQRAKCKGQNARSKMQGARGKMQGAKYKERRAGSNLWKISNLPKIVRSLERIKLKSLLLIRIICEISVQKKEKNQRKSVQSVTSVV